MKKVICEICEKPIEDWKGNVMIPTKSFEGEIDDLQVWCKPCTSKLDARGVGRKYHNLWELSWLKEEREEILKESNYVERFSNRIKEKVMKIINSQ